MAKQYLESNKMWRRFVITLLSLSLVLFVGRVGLVRAACSGAVQCKFYDSSLKVCTSTRQTTIRCVESGGACQWSTDCENCPISGGDCMGTADGTTPSPPPGTGTSCFPAGTRVMMENGEERNIENVRVGDRVVSQSESGERAVSQVSAVETPVRDHMCTIIFADGGRLRLTDEHPPYTQDGWKSIVPENTLRENSGLKVQDLTTADSVRRADGSMAQKFHSQCPLRAPW